MEIGEIIDGYMYLGDEQVFDDARVKGGAWHTVQRWAPVHACCECGHTESYPDWEINFWRCPVCGEQN